MAQAKKTIQTFSSKTRTTTRTTFSQILSSARMNQRHLAGKRNSRRHSSTGLNENIAVAEKSYQMLRIKKWSIVPGPIHQNNALLS